MLKYSVIGDNLPENNLSLFKAITAVSSVDISHDFVSHYKVASWGSSILIMEKNGKAFGRIYWYSDDKSVVYLDCLSVNAEIRRRGIGTELQEIRENIGKNLGATIACLWVQKNTWMQDWYKRRGYEDWRINENEENAIWMRKLLVISQSYSLKNNKSF